MPPAKWRASRKPFAKAELFAKWDFDLVDFDGLPEELVGELSSDEKSEV
jgi:hypothetical protein